MFYIVLIIWLLLDQLSKYYVMNHFLLGESLPVIPNAVSYTHLDVYKRQELAKGAELELFYDTPDTIDLDRVEQTDQSDLEFLMKVCKDNGLALKVSDKQVIIFDETKYETEKVVATLIKGPMPTDLTEDQIKELGEIIPYQGSYSLKTSLKDVYWGCHVKHKSRCV